eukprot:m.35850 g.35850  ORF g.35850 m.35850 type:complete len:297 (-) comp12424_c0_seq1:55-945(-)
MACPAVTRFAMSTTTMNVDEPKSLVAAVDGVAQDRLRHLLCLQQTPWAYMTSTQKGSLLPTMRDSTVSFLRQLAGRKSISDDCFVEGVHRFDTFLSLMKVQPKHLRLISVCCLHLAVEAQPAARRQSALAWTRATGKIFTVNDFDRMLKIVRPKLAASGVLKPSPVALLHAVLPCLDLMTLPEPAAQRKLDVILEDAEMGYERQQVEACYELAREHLADLVKRYSIVSSMSPARLVVTAVTFSLEELFAEQAQTILATLCDLLGVTSAQLKQSVWLAAAETSKAFPVLVTSFKNKA